MIHCLNTFRVIETNSFGNLECGWIVYVHMYRLKSDDVQLIREPVCVCTSRESLMVVKPPLNWNLLNHTVNILASTQLRYTASGVNIFIYHLHTYIRTYVYIHRYCCHHFTCVFFLKRAIHGKYLTTFDIYKWFHYKKKCFLVY